MRNQLTPSRSRARGFTLIECLVALGVLSIGALAAVQIVTLMSGGTASVAVQTEAIALASRAMAEVQNARFVVGNEDPGLVVGTQTRSEIDGGDGTVATPVTGSEIRTVGQFPAVNPRLRVRYEVRWCDICEQPFGPGQVGIRSVDVLITVDDDFLPEGERRLRRPLFFVLRREYAPSVAGATVHGW